MVSLDQNIRQILTTILEDIPKPIPPSPNGFNTGAFLTQLVRSWPRPLNQKDADGLEALCKKVAVAKKIWAVYDPGWKKSAAPEPLPTPLWSLLIATLLAYGRGGDNKNAMARGIALKRINTAFQALDLANTQEPCPCLPELKTLAQICLDEILRR